VFSGSLASVRPDWQWPVRGSDANGGDEQALVENWKLVPTLLVSGAAETPAPEEMDR